MNATNAAQEPASITGHHEKTVRQYHKEFFLHREGSLRKANKANTSLLNDETLRLQAAMWVRENAYRKSEANMTAT